MKLPKTERHRLPKFPATVIPTFKSMMEVLGETDIMALRQSLDSFLRAAKENTEAFHSDLKQGELLVETCNFLLDNYDNYDDRGKSLIIAAARYVAVGDDCVPEHIFASGYFDDTKVVNYVLECLAIENKYLPVD